MGPDPSVFGTASRLAAWAGLCPGNDESAGNHRLRSVLFERTPAVAHTKKCQFQAHHNALTVRRGYKRGVVAAAQKARTLRLRGPAGLLAASEQVGPLLRTCSPAA